MWLNQNFGKWACQSNLASFGKFTFYLFQHFNILSNYTFSVAVQNTISPLLMFHVSTFILQNQTSIFKFTLVDHHSKSAVLDISPLGTLANFNFFSGLLFFFLICQNIQNSKMSTKERRSLRVILFFSLSRGVFRVLSKACDRTFWKELTGQSHMGHPSWMK